MKYFNIILFSLLSFGYLNAKEYPNFIINNNIYKSDHFFSITPLETFIQDTTLVIQFQGISRINYQPNLGFFICNLNTDLIFRLDSIPFSIYNIHLKNLSNYFLQDSLYTVIDIKKRKVPKLEDSSKSLLISNPYIYKFNSRQELISTFVDTVNYSMVSDVVEAICFDYMYLSTSTSMSYLWDKQGNVLKNKFYLIGDNIPDNLKKTYILDVDSNYIWTIFSDSNTENFLNKINKSTKVTNTINLAQPTIDSNYFNFKNIIRCKNNDFAYFSKSSNKYFFYRYSQEMKLLNSSLLNLDSSIKFAGIIELNNGNFLIFGQNTISFIQGIEHKTKFFMVLINNHGDIINKYEWGQDDEYQVITNAVQRADNKIIIVGLDNYIDSNNVNKNCISTFIIDLDINSIDATENKDNWLDISPIPANNYIKIKNSNYQSISEFLIFDSNAKLVSKFKLQYEDQIQIDVSNYAKGAYYIVPNSNDANIFAGTKFIVE